MYQFLRKNVWGLVLLLLLGCKEQKEEKLFSLISKEHSNISFNNKIWETNEVHYFSFPYLYIGAGVGVGDFDNDGDTDYIVGNLGENNAYKVTREQPLRIYAKDFDGNSSIDAIATRFIQDKEVSIAPRNLLATQLNSVKGVFKSYNDFAQSSIQDLLQVLDTAGMQVLQANTFSSVHLENLGNGEFNSKKLPLPAQFSMIHGMQVTDLNHDGNLDMLLTGNMYQTEVISGYIDGSNGLVLLGDGKGDFKELPFKESGFYVPGDAKSLVQYQTNKGKLGYLATVNSASTHGFKTNIATGVSLVSWPKSANSAMVYLTNGAERKEEKYWGSGYLSQSKPYIIRTKNIKKVQFK
ncbi:FG-GAP repeat protein [Croceivirga sp. JEA036]|uniref:FG-GAP repeat protein n=1 Tax=Croceivirga sp. JEA036 TaxID=2721162 RepID=UPI00143958D7|nr:FG-GAP repeat protein [Croceivirga sp. JEA036]NJB35178.1 VCBS repeat-containing protein [Croceivirga sp. JEA036]